MNPHLLESQIHDLPSPRRVKSITPDHVKDQIRFTGFMNCPGMWSRERMKSLFEGYNGPERRLLLAPLVLLLFYDQN